MDVYCIRNM